jgi:Tol biopolymer transport system component
MGTSLGTRVYAVARMKVANRPFPRWSSRRPAAIAVGTAVGMLTTLSGAAPRPSLLLYWSDHGNPGPSLWAMRPDGSRQHLIYHAYANAKRPTLSPDGAWIAFDGASPGKKPFSDFDVQIVRTNGKARSTVAGTNAFEIDAQWSPDGRLLSFSRWPRSADWRSSWIWTARRDGKQVRRIARGQFARWSPDGKKLVFDAPTKESDGDLFIVNAEGSGRRQLTRTRALEQPADWSPDGRKILFTRYTTSGSIEIAVIGVDGTGLRRLATVHGDEAGAAAWSPDGSKILYTNQPGHYAQCFVMDADGSHRHNVSRNHFDDIATSWH